MCAAVTNQDQGQLRLSIQAQSPLPEFEGKVYRVLIREGTAYCEVMAPTSQPSILSFSLTTGEKKFPISHQETDLRDILIAQKKSYLRLNDISGNSDNLSFAEMGNELGIAVDLLRNYIPSKSPDGYAYLSRDNLKDKKCLIQPIPAKKQFGPEAIAEDVIILSDRTVLSSKTDTVTNGGIIIPFLENGFLKIPGTEPAVQLASKGAYKSAKDTILSIDEEGVVSSIVLSDPSKPVVSEAGTLSLPTLDKVTIIGVCGPENGQVIFVTGVEDGKSKLFAFDKDSLELIGEVVGVQGAISSDELGNIYFVDDNKTLRVVSSNIGALGGKKIVGRSSQRLAALQGAAAALDRFELPTELSDEVATGAHSEEMHVLRDVQAGLLAKVAPEIEKCTSLADIGKLQGRIERLRVKGEFVQIPAAFELVDIRIADRKESLAYPEIEQRLVGIESALKSDDQNLPVIRSDLHNLIEVRSSVVLRDQAKRADIGLRIEKVSSHIESLTHDIDEQAATQVKSEMVVISKDIGTCATQEEVLALVMEGQGKEIKETISEISDRELREKLQGEFNLIVTTRIKDIAETLQSKKLREADGRLKIREEYQALSETLNEALATVSDRKGLQDQSNSPVVRALRNQIEKLPEEEREDAHAALNRMFAERGKVVDFSQRVNDLSKTKGFVKFGEIEFPRAGDFELLYEPKFIPMKGRNGFVELVWRDARGKEYRPEVQPLTNTANELERQELITSTKEEASKFFMVMTPKAPTVRSNWVINKHYEQYLGELGELLLHQRKLQQGLVIIEGDAGAAKSGLVQMFCALTNRPMNTFACNGQTEKEDLTYLYQYDPEKGTYRLDSGFIEALQTPNTVVLLEEINSLPVPVAKMLNTLLDFRRELYLPDGRVIKADPSVLIIGLQNPQSYAGVNKLSKEFLSRALVMEMDYAKEKEGNRFLPYEAEMYSKYRPLLAELTQEQFYAVWDQVVNNAPSDLAGKVMSADTEREIKGLKRLVAVANSARAAYRAYQREESTEPFEFIFSYREAEVIASLWNGSSRIDDMIARIVLPKIPDAIEKTAMRALISSR